MRFSILILFLICFSGFAGQQGVTQSFTQTEPKDWSYDIVGDYVLGSRILKASQLGSQATYHYSLEALRNFHLFGQYYLQAGIEAEQFVFSRSDGNAFPSSLNSFNAEIAFSYWSGEDFYPLLRIEPGAFFAGRHVTANSFDMPLRIAAGIKVRDNLYLVIGLTADPFTENPVVPIGGFNWKINDRFNLKAVFPKPRFSYLPNKEWEFFIAGEAMGGGYRNGPTPDRRTNNAVLEYSDLRAGAGASYNPTPDISVEVAAGWVFQRRFNYFHAGPEYTTRGSPYLKMDLSFSF
jgi:Domain of unknown function (DUF6268)